MIYDYTIKTGKGEDLNLADYKGKVIMVVNTATGCGFTPQYAPIEQMYKDYHDQGLEILDIPCNQFGGQPYRLLQIFEMSHDIRTPLHIILGCANVRERERKEALDAGMNAFAEKPIFIDRLFAAMAKFL